MLGIMIKDLYETVLVKKNMLSLILGLVAIFVCSFVLKNLYSFILIVGICIPFMGSTVLQCSVEQDEISGFDKVQLTYPLTKKEIILSKYISGIIFVCFISLFALIETLIYVYGYGVVDIVTGLTVWFMGVLISVIELAICYVGFIWLGNKKGIFMYIVMCLGVAIIYILTSLNIGIESILQLDRPILIFLGIVIAFISLILSYLGALKIYTRKYS